MKFRPALERDDDGEADEVAEAAGALLREGSVAVLGRTRKQLVKIIEALKARGVPYRAQDIYPLSDNPNVKDVESLVRALLTPSDRLAWLSVLRAPWCGLSLRELHALAQDRSVPIPVAVRAALEGASPEGEGGRLPPGLRRAWAVLGKALEAVGRKKIGVLARGAWTALGAPAYLSEGELADIENVFGLIDSVERGGRVGSLKVLEAKLGELYASPDPSVTEGVEVMTIHKSKGLEFDAVLLPGLGRRPGGGDAELLSWFGTPDDELVVAPVSPDRDDLKDPIAAYVRRLELEKDTYERMRLMYVAATRAKERLILWGHAQPRRDRTLRPEKGSLLDVLWPAVSGEFDRAEAPPVEPEAEADAAGEPLLTVKRLPASWSAPEAPAPAWTPDRDAALPEEASHDPDFWWAEKMAACVGVVSHRLFERIGVEGVEKWSAGRLASMGGQIAAQLKSEGVVSSELQGALKRVVAVVTAALEDPKGREILTRSETSMSEVRLTRAREGQLLKRIVDRTYVDGEGVRWIVDFKTGSHTGAGLEEFLASEAERYRDQLAEYVEMFKQLEPGRAVKAALYHPHHRSFRQVEL